MQNSNELPFVSTQALARDEALHLYMKELSLVAKDKEIKGFAELIQFLEKPALSEQGETYTQQVLHFILSDVTMLEFILQKFNEKFEKLNGSSEGESRCEEYQNNDTLLLLALCVFYCQFDLKIKTFSTKIIKTVVNQYYQQQDAVIRMISPVHVNFWSQIEELRELEIVKWLFCEINYTVVKNLIIHLVAQQIYSDEDKLVIRRLFENADFNFKRLFEEFKFSDDFKKMLVQAYPESIIISSIVEQEINVLTSSEDSSQTVYQLIEHYGYPILKERALELISDKIRELTHYNDQPAAAFALLLLKSLRARLTNPKHHIHFIQQEVQHSREDSSDNSADQMFMPVSGIIYPDLDLICSEKTFLTLAATLDHFFPFKPPEEEHFFHGQKKNEIEGYFQTLAQMLFDEDFIQDFAKLIIRPEIISQPALAKQLQKTYEAILHSQKIREIENAFRSFVEGEIGSLPEKITINQLELALCNEYPIIFRTHSGNVSRMIDLFAYVFNKSPIVFKKFLHAVYSSPYQLYFDARKFEMIVKGLITNLQHSALLKLLLSDISSRNNGDELLKSMLSSLYNQPEQWLFYIQALGSENLLLLLPKISSQWDDVYKNSHRAWLLVLADELGKIVNATQEEKLKLAVVTIAIQYFPRVISSVDEKSYQRLYQSGDMERILDILKSKEPITITKLQDLCTTRESERKSLASITYRFFDKSSQLGYELYRNISQKVNEFAIPKKPAPFRDDLAL